MTCCTLILITLCLPLHFPVDLHYTPSFCYPHRAKSRLFPFQKNIQGNNRRSFFSSASSSSASSTSLASVVEAASTGVQASYEYLHPSYEVVEKFFIPEYGLEGISYNHKKTGAQVISIISPDDDNKVFGITFRTPPSDRYTSLPPLLSELSPCRHPPIR